MSAGKAGRPWGSVVLAGPLCAGKSTLAVRLGNCGWNVLAVRDVIAELIGDKAVDRGRLQAAGSRLERDQPGSWLAKAAAVAPKPVVVDAARTRAQTDELLRQVADCSVVYLQASPVVRRRRFIARADIRDAESHFDAIAASPLEQEAETLWEAAHLVLSTEVLPPDALAVAVKRHLAEFRALQS